ncbi:MAG: hypothetical protein Q7S58_01435 [Candidatus Binatus sp.]|uniref:hypothetical protein n=1 Tax=Candidatus Binatus sp. TaxID=2811406 RepID=UPI0027158278|nr:hypothetical protein [Candidatus Binatus sp.]MDO8431052.1 hypothetical protein [Candidatus Binatus sp.]
MKKRSGRIGYARRRRWPGFAHLIVAAMLLAGCAYSLVSGDHVNSSQAEKIEAGLPTLRQLQFKQPVPLVVKTRDEAEAMIEADMMRDYTDSQLQVEGIVGALLGLYPSQMDLKAETLKLLRSQVAGFYDAHEKTMVLVKGGADLGFWNATSQFLIQRDLVGEMLLAHELTHALQDQNFGLEKSLDAVKDNDDRALALKAVAEGDATLAGFAYAMGRMDNDISNRLIGGLKGMPQSLAAESPGTPEGLSVPLLFQYSEGVRFVAEAYRRGGWSAVDALYQRPPESTHQILHPGIFFEDRAHTPRIALSGYEQIMHGWRKVDDSTYGELLLRVILERNLGKQSSEIAIASRWTADRMIVLQQSRGLNVIWMLTFTDKQTASHFAVVYATLLDRLLGGASAHRIDYRANAALVIIGEGANYFDQLAPAIWNASTIETASTSTQIAVPPTPDEQ